MPFQATLARSSRALKHSSSRHDAEVHVNAASLDEEVWLIKGQKNDREIHSCDKIIESSDIEKKSSE